MPRKLEFYTPDQLDCHTLVNAIGHDFGLVTEIVTEYTVEHVRVIVRCRPVGKSGVDVVQVQAMVTAPLRTAKSLYQYQYSALLDCWHQCDRGMLAVAGVKTVYGWDGRPEAPTARKA